MLLHQSGREPIQADFLIVPGNSPPRLAKRKRRDVKHLSNNPQMLGSEKLFAKYTGTGDGIGCLKNIQVTLHIDKTVPQVAGNMIEHHFTCTLRNLLKYRSYNKKVILSLRCDQMGVLNCYPTQIQYSK